MTGARDRDPSGRLDLHRYLDDELSDLERREFENDLQSNPALDEHRADLEEISSLLVEAGNTPRPSPAAQGTPHRLPPPASAFTLGSSLAASLLLGVTLLLVSSIERPAGENKAEEMAVAEDLTPRTVEIVPHDGNPLLAVNLPSRHKDIHIVWIYPLNPEKGTLP